MIKTGISAAATLGAALTLSALGQSSFSLVTSAPTTDVLLARGDGAANGSAGSQATFGYRNADTAGSEGTRGRGQSFVINSTVGATYDISSLTVSLAGGAGTAVRPDGDLTLTVFEFTGTGATAADQANDTDTDSDWRTKTGGASGTQLFSGTYEIAAGMSFPNSQFVSISFDPGVLQLDDDTAYGFFFQYTLDDVTGLSTDVTIAFDADNNVSPNPAGTLLNTNPSTEGPGTGANGSSTSRDLNYFITGTVAGAPAAPTITASSTFFEAGNSVDLDITFDTAVDTATLETPGGMENLFDLDDGSTNGDAVAGDGMVTFPDSPTDNFDYVVTTTEPGFPDGTASTTVKVYDTSTIPADNAFSTAIKTDSPLFYYRFEEAADSGYLLDASPNGHHTDDITGTLIQGGGPGGMQNAGELTNASVLVPATSDMSASFTATAVVNLDFFQAGGIQHIFAMTDGTGTGRSIFYPGNGQLRTYIDGSTLTNPGGTVPSDETSCLLHFIYDSDPDGDSMTDDQEVRFYINGELQGGAGVPTTNLVAANVGNWVLGSHKVRTLQFLNGWLDETAVFEAALTDVQIAAHATAFYAAADPMLGFDADFEEVTLGDSVVLTWKTSDQATDVTLNGSAVDGAAAGGVYTTTISPTEDTTYTLVVSGPGGPFMKAIDVTVLPPPAPPEITSITTDGASPPFITIEVQGNAQSTYNVTASADLLDFSFVLTTVTTDGNGFGTTSFTGDGTAEFYRIETPVPIP